MSHIALVGQGVIGLTTAEALVSAGHSVTIYSKDDNHKTASYGAGAYWWPHKAWPPERVSNWSAITYRKYEELSTLTGSGIHMHRHFRYCEREDETRYALDLTKNVREIPTDTLPFFAIDAFECLLPVIDVPVYMPWLKKRVEDLGVTFVTRSIHSFSELASEADAIVNCSGLGAKELAGDDQVYPIRGQVVMVEKDPKLDTCIRLVHRDPVLTLILPRSKDILLGGTVNENSDSTEPNDQETSEIIERCSRVLPDIANLKILGASAALRPGRFEVRLELDLSSCSKPVVHNYGHGGSGYTIAYGCAEEVVAMLASS
jgi:D-amino-acid oxidase